EHQVDAGLDRQSLQRFLSVVAEEEFQLAVTDLAAESLAHEQLQVGLIVHHENLARHVVGVLHPCCSDCLWDRVTKKALGGNLPFDNVGPPFLAAASPTDDISTWP